MVCWVNADPHWTGSRVCNIGEVGTSVRTARRSAVVLCTPRHKEMKGNEKHRRTVRTALHQEKEKGCLREREYRTNMRQRTTLASPAGTLDCPTFAALLLTDLCGDPPSLPACARRFVRIGALVLLVHDLSDVLLEGAKLAKYAGRELAASLTFAAFALSFFALRLVVYPAVLIRSARCCPPPRACCCHGAPQGPSGLTCWTSRSGDEGCPLPVVASQLF